MEIENCTYVINVKDFTQTWSIEKNHFYQLLGTGDIRPTYTKLEAFVKTLSQNGVEVITQDVLPDIDSKYWKVENNQIVEMTTEEKGKVDALNLYYSKKYEFKGKKIKITIKGDETIPGFLYIASISPEIQQYVLAKESILTDINEANYMDAYAYLDEVLDGAFKDILKNDTSGRILIEHIDTYNPNSEHYRSAYAL